MYKNNPSMEIKVAKKLEKQIICLPSSPKLKEQLNYLYDKLAKNNC